jgi:hypothetical protein
VVSVAPSDKGSSAEIDLGWRCHRTILIIYLTLLVYSDSVLKFNFNTEDT